MHVCPGVASALSQAIGTARSHSARTPVPLPPPTITWMRRVDSRGLSQTHCCRRFPCMSKKTLKQLAQSGSQTALTKLRNRRRARIRRSAPKCFSRRVLEQYIRCFSRREIPCLSSRVDATQGAEQGRSGVTDAPIQAGRSGGPPGRRA